jgi:hypothetical protein
VGWCVNANINVEDGAGTELCSHSDCDKAARGNGGES